MNRKNIFASFYKNTTAALFGLLMILVSCQREEIPTEDTSLKGNAPIEFSGITASLETKAGEDESTTNLPSNFTVWAQNGTNFNVFGQAGTDVTKTESGNTFIWNYTPVRYWQTGDYAFYAIAPTTINMATGNLSANNGLTLTFKDGWNLADNQTDLLIAYQTASGETQLAKENGPDKIELIFGHMLSQIRFSARSAEGSDIVIKVKKVEIYGNSKTAESLKAVYNDENESLNTTWTFANGSTTTNSDLFWEQTYDDESKHITLTNSSTGEGENKIYSYTKICPEFLVFPEAFANADGKKVPPTVVVTYTVNGAERTKSAQIIHDDNNGTTTWEAGKIYDYKIAISADKITFAEPKVTPWIPGGQADDNIEF